MSMFHELMMRKKEEIMYATIKETLTENNGVFSGFSASNYLALQEPFAPTGSWEVCFKVKFGSNVSLAKYFFGSTSYGIVLGNTDTPSGAFKVFLSSNGISWDIGILSTGINNPADSIRYVKIGFTGEKYYIEQSEDGITYIGRAELNSTKKIYSVPVRIGNSYEPSNRYWQGAIDLNNSYIKLGSTKYNLQAVVGYTVVGSPTITDGVVSGFTTSDYLTLPRTSNLANQYEIKAKLKITQNSSSYMAILLSFYNWGKQGIKIKADTLSANLRYIYNETTTDKDIRLQYNFQENVDYYIKYVYKNNEFYIGVSEDDINYVYSQKETIPSGVTLVQLDNSGVGSLSIGRTYQYSAFQGEIDLNETYIKINNKLWFNGQQA